jgi:hypothetical protein
MRGDHGLGLGAGDETVTGFRSTAPAVGDNKEWRPAWERDMEERKAGKEN